MSNKSFTSYLRLSLLQIQPVYVMLKYNIHSNSDVEAWRNIEVIIIYVQTMEQQFIRNQNNV